MDFMACGRVKKCPYCLQYWREESQIFIKFEKVFWWCTPTEILPQIFLQLPLVKLFQPSRLPSGDVNLSSGVSTFLKKEDEKSKFPADFWL